MLIEFDDMIADIKSIEANKKLSPIVTELFLNGRKHNISPVFISQSYIKVSKTIRLNAADYFIMKIPNKRELCYIPNNIASKNLSDIDFKNFMKLYKDLTKEPYSFLVDNTALASDHPLRFRKKL